MLKETEQQKKEPLMQGAAPFSGLTSDTSGRLAEWSGPHATLEVRGKGFLLTRADSSFAVFCSSLDALQKLPFLLESDIAKELTDNGYILFAEGHFLDDVEVFDETMPEDLEDFEGGIEEGFYSDDRFTTIGGQFALAQHDNVGVRCELARVRTDLHPDVIQRLLIDEESVVRCMVAAHQPISNYWVHRLLDEEIFYLKAIAQAIVGNPHINLGEASVFERLIEHGRDLSVRTKLLDSRFLDDSQRLRVAQYSIKDPILFFESQSYAKRPAPIAVIRDYLSDDIFSAGWPSARCVIAAHPEADSVLLKRVIDGATDRALAIIARRSDLTDDIALALASHPAKWVRRELAMSPSFLARDVLVKLCKDASEVVRTLADERIGQFSSMAAELKWKSGINLNQLGALERDLKQLTALERACEKPSLELKLKSGINLNQLTALERDLNQVTALERAAELEWKSGIHLNQLGALERACEQPSLERPKSVADNEDASTRMG